MKRVFLTFTFVLAVFVVCAQEPAGQIPLLVCTTEDYKRPDLFVACDCVTDTLAVAFQVKLCFDERFGEDVRITEAKEIIPHILIYENVEGERVKLFSFKPIESGFDRCLWDSCTRQFRVWLKHQPYSEMCDVERFYGHDRYVVPYRVYCVSRKVGSTE